MATAINLAKQSLPAPVPAPPPPRVHRFTVEQYHRMLAASVFSERDKVELLEGWVVDKMPQNPVHAGTVSLLQGLLQAKLGKGWVVRVQSPITLEDSEPEPDLAVVRGPAERYLTAHPTPVEIALLIEVADTSVDQDRSVKGRTYARAAIPVYWIVNLLDLTVEVYTQPRPGKAPRYQSQERLGIEAGVPLAMPGRKATSIPVRRLFP